jgi:predicted nucleic acid-binding protein
MTRYFVDTNLFLRLLLKNHPEQSPIAERIFQKAEEGKLKLWTTDVVISEIVWVLKSFFKQPPFKIQQSVSKVFGITNLSILNKKLLIQALDDFVKKNVDFVDAYNYQLAKLHDRKILSFDEDFDKLGKREGLNKISN